MNKLYLIPLPLAENSQAAMPPQVAEVVPQLDYVLAEDLRTARRFISSLKTGKKIDEIVFFELDKRTKWADLQTFMNEIPGGKVVGVMSEAGCPGIADPGALAVQYAHQHQWEVLPLVGPSSVLLALMASGLNGQSFAFVGYLPIDRAERNKAIKALEKESQQKRQAQVFIETPFRNNHLMQSLVEQLQPETQLCVAANLTGEGQRISTKRVKAWKHQMPELHKIPTVFILQA